MRLLAIDTALAACSAAVFDSQCGVVASESQPMVRGHAEALMPLIARVMRAAGVAFSEVERIAVTVGPGSFTGLRVGVAAARGIALAAGTPAVGITTLAAFAAPNLAVGGGTPVLAAIDARHHHVYMQMFEPSGAPRHPARIATIAEAVVAAAAAPSRLAGSAAALIANAWPQGAGEPLVIDARDAPDIEWVARLGAAADVTGAMPKPLYLSAPDVRPPLSMLARR